MKSVKQNVFESTPQQKQLAELGRSMMDYSETSSMAKLKDKEIKPYNDLSDVGAKLTKVGSNFGPKLKDFTEFELTVIQDFIKYRGTNLVQGGPCLRTSF